MSIHFFIQNGKVANKVNKMISKSAGFGRQATGPSPDGFFRGAKLTQAVPKPERPTTTFKQKHLRSFWCLSPLPFVSHSTARVFLFFSFISNLSAQDVSICSQQADCDGSESCSRKFLRVLLTTAGLSADAFFCLLVTLYLGQRQWEIVVDLVR